MASLSPTSQKASRRLRVVLALAVGLFIGAGVASGIAAAWWPQGRQPSVGAVLVDAPAARSGPFLVQAREMRCGLGEIVGTHAEFYPKQGQFCRVRVGITADEAAEDTWDSLLQQLATSDGPGPGTNVAASNVAASLDAMHVKRQPLQITLGGYATLEIDLWFDLPKTAQPSELLIRATAADSPASIPLPHHSWPFGATG